MTHPIFAAHNRRFFGILLALTPPEGESPNRRAILHLVVVMKVYSKKPMDLNALENQLIARGLIDGNRKLRHALETVGYFRLTGYLYPFRKPNSDDYKSGTTFESLWSICTFDRKLRLMAADALARIEVAVRSLIVTSHTAAFPNDAFAYIDHNSLPGLKVRKHTELLNSISAAMGHAKGEPDLKHLKTEYDIEHYPPIWNVMEHAPFGIVTLFYEGLDATVKQSVANAFFMTPNAFLGVLMALKVAKEYLRPSFPLLEQAHPCAAFGNSWTAQGTGCPS